MNNCKGYNIDDNLKEAYRAAVSKEQLPPGLKSKTLSRIKMCAAPKKHVKWAVVIPAAAVAVLSCFSALAYNVTGGFKRPAEWGGLSGHVYAQNENGDVSQIADPAIMDRAGTQLDRTVGVGNLAVTVKNVVSDDKVLYVSFDAQTKDGSPLQLDSEFSKSVLVRQRFKEAYIECGGKQYKLYVNRIDNAAQPAKGSFEGTASVNGENLKGQSMKLVLKDFADSTESCADIKFKYASLADIYSRMTLCPEEDFIRTSIYSKYADGSIAYNYTLPEGTQHVAFSDAYPGAYIDNIGFHGGGDFIGGTKTQEKWLYISIVPGSEENAQALAKLAFQNVKTFDMFGAAGRRDAADSRNYAKMEVASDGTLFYSYDAAGERNAAEDGNPGRIVIALAVGLDSFSVSHRDIKAEDLSNYRLVGALSWSDPVMQQGTWETEFTLENQDAPKTFAVNQEITVNGDKRTISDITLSAFSMTMTCTSANNDLKNMSLSHISFIMKDGSEVATGVKWGGGGKDSYSLECQLKTPVDVDKVAGIKIWDTEIPLQ